MSTGHDDHREWTDRLSELLEGTLSIEEHRAVEEHLGACGSCRRVLDELRSVIDGARALGPIEPPRDLWSGIEATIRAPASSEAASKVIALPGLSERGPMPASAGRPSRVTLSRAQLVAASILLVVGSSLATWVAGPALGSGAEQGASATPAAASDLVFVTGAPAEPPKELAEELARLEATLAEARDVLDPNTLRVLARNLNVIERAIEDSRNALAQDPGNEFLTQHLDRVYQRKLTYLRDVAELAEWSG